MHPTPTQMPTLMALGLWHVLSEHSSRCCSLGFPRIESPRKIGPGVDSPPDNLARARGALDALNGTGKVCLDRIPPYFNVSIDLQNSCNCLIRVHFQWPWCCQRTFPSPWEFCHSPHRQSIQQLYICRSARDITSASCQRNLDLTHSLGTLHTISRIFLHQKCWTTTNRFSLHLE